MDLSTTDHREFREVFHNCYATGFSVGALLSLIFGLVVGLVFSGVLLLGVGYYALALISYVFGSDVWGFKGELPAGPPSLGSLCGGCISILIWVCFFAYLGPHSLIRLKRRLAARWHVLTGRPLAAVEGGAILDPSSESGYVGLEIREFYFNFEDCWLNVEDEDLAELEQARGAMRIWYIPGTREWTNPATGKLVKYDSLLVRAEWRPLGV